MRRLLLIALLAGCTPMGFNTLDSQPQQSRRGPECRMSSRGQQVCGYHCRVGSDGNVACANSPDGVCAMGSDGRVTCTQVALASPGVAPPPGSLTTPFEKPACSGNIDCGSGQWCRDRGDGRRQCMGNEPRGAFCSQPLDCDGGLFCKPRGDGFSVCM